MSEAFPDTFKISADGSSITCLRCGRTSHHPSDVEYKYCAGCKVFHEDIWPPARQFFIHDKPKPKTEGA